MLAVPHVRVTDIHCFQSIYRILGWEGRTRITEPKGIEFPSMLLNSCMCIAGVFFHRVDLSGEEPIPHEAWHMQKG